MSASPHRVHAKFWLLDAPDSIIGQGRRNPDGTGLGYFHAHGAPVIDKEPLAASADEAFAVEARHVSSTVFLAHVRFATTGARTVENCHPFVIDDRIFAHNGAIGGLKQLEARLGADMTNVRGQTDSERYFALVSKEIRAHGGDVGAGLQAAVRWIAANLPVSSMNCVLATGCELWAFRYPRRHRLYVLERQAGGPHGCRDVHYTSSALRVHSPHLSEWPSVVVASEPLDDSRGWRLLEPGELVHVGRNLEVSSHILIEGRPSYGMLLPTRGVRAWSAISRAIARRR